MILQRRVSGSCLCGTVEFSVGLPTLFCGHCHCKMCQRSHGAGFVTWFAVPPERLSIEKGHRELARYQSSDHGTRSFCRVCGSSLFCESTHHPDRIDIVLANMHEAIDRLPQVHVYYDSHAAWVHIDDDLPRLGGESGSEPLAR